MKKYTTPLLAQYAIATEGLMNMSLKTPKPAAGTLDGAEADTFEKQFSIWGDDYPPTKAKTWISTAPAFSKCRLIEAPGSAQALHNQPALLGKSSIGASQQSGFAVLRRAGRLLGGEYPCGQGTKSVHLRVPILARLKHRRQTAGGRRQCAGQLRRVRTFGRRLPMSQSAAHHFFRKLRTLRRQLPLRGRRLLII